MTEIPELDKMWKERQDADKPDPDDTFVPAKEATPFDPNKEDLVVRVEL